MAAQSSWERRKHSELTPAAVSQRAFCCLLAAGFTLETGHFTQVVWKATTKLGCFAALCNNLIPDAGLMGGCSCRMTVYETMAAP